MSTQAARPSIPISPLGAVSVTMLGKMQTPLDGMLFLSTMETKEASLQLSKINHPQSVPELLDIDSD